MRINLLFSALIQNISWHDLAIKQLDPPINYIKQKNLVPLITMTRFHVSNMMKRETINMKYRCETKRDPVYAYTR